MIATGILTASFTHHYGLQKKTTVRQHKIYSAAGKSSPAGILVAKQVGRSSGCFVMVYRDSVNQKAQPHFVPNKNDRVDIAKKHADYRTADVRQATVKITTTKWGWQNATAKFWLNCGQAGELAQQKATVTIPAKTWVVLSPSQLKQLKKQQVNQSQQQARIPVRTGTANTQGNQQAVAAMAAQKIKASLR